MTSDKYIEAVRPFLWLLRKYWPVNSPSVEVIVAGFTKPEFDLNKGNNSGVFARFHSIGDFDKYPINKWSNSLIDLLNSLSNEYVTIMLEDYWVIRQVNVPAICLAKDYMDRYPKTLKFDLAADRYFAGGATRDFRRSGWLDIVKSDINSPYHMSLMTGMWRRDLLLEVLLPDWSPWDVEIDGTRHLQNFPFLEVVGSAQWPIKHTLAFRGGDFSKINLQELQQEDVYALRQQGFLERWT